MFVFKTSDVIQRMYKILAENQKQVKQPVGDKSTESRSVDRKPDLRSQGSCLTSGSAKDTRNVELLEAGGNDGHVVSTGGKRKECCDVLDSGKEKEHCQTSDTGSADSVVEDGDLDPKGADSDLNKGCKIVSIEANYGNIDVLGIRERIKKRKLDRQREMKLVGAMDDHIDSETWIEHELESGIEKSSTCLEK